MLITNEPHLKRCVASGVQRNVARGNHPTHRIHLHVNTPLTPADPTRAYRSREKCRPQNPFSEPYS